MNDSSLVESPSLREEFCTEENTLILEQVGSLEVIPKTDYAVTESVARFFQVSVDTIRKAVRRHREELESDGYEVIASRDFRERHGKALLKSKSRFIAVFPRRAVLRIAMVLQDSVIAKEIRSYLLDAEETLLKVQGDPSLQNIAGQLTNQASELAQHANQLSRHAGQLTHHADELTMHADQLISQAEVIQAMINEVCRNRDDIQDIRGTMQFYERRISALENMQQQNTAPTLASPDFVSAEQQKTLIAKVNRKKGDAKTIWQDFQNFFKIDKAPEFLPASRFDEAMKWIKSWPDKKRKARKTKA